MKKLILSIAIAVPILSGCSPSMLDYMSAVSLNDKGLLLTPGLASYKDGINALENNRLDYARLCFCTASELGYKKADYYCRQLSQLGEKTLSGANAKTAASVNQKVKQKVKQENQVIENSSPTPTCYITGYVGVGTGMMRVNSEDKVSMYETTCIPKSSKPITECGQNVFYVNNQKAFVTGTIGNGYKVLIPELEKNNQGSTIYSIKKNLYCPK